MNNTGKLLKTIVITGANKGIGFGMVRHLLKSKNSLDSRIILTSRNEELGKKAIQQLATELNLGENDDRLVYCQLDIDSAKSQDDFVDYVKTTYGSISTLVNNAGVTVPTDDFDTKVFDFTFNVNFYGTVDFTEKMIKNKLVKDKIVFISSSVTRWIEFSKDVRKSFENSKTCEEIISLSKEFRTNIENKTWKQNGWPEMCYGVSKACLSFYVKILGSRQDVVDQNLQVYSCCPGWVKTDMGGQNAHRTLDEGVVTPCYLVELKQDGINKDLQGNFFYDEKVASIFKEEVNIFSKF